MAGSGAEALPLALRLVLYRSLTRDAGAAYNVNPNGCVTLPRQSLAACFYRGGVRFTGAGSLALHLVSYGRGEVLSPVKAVEPVIRANRVGYAHGNLTEWWRVLPVGFEQGFTIARRPGGKGELTLALAANGKTDLHNGALTWGRLRYGDLVVTDAQGKVVPATLKTKGDHIQIAVNDARATYPLTVDPLVWIAQKVTASDGTAGDYFGGSVAVSGTNALIGAFSATVNGNTGQGAVYVVSKSNGTWTQSQKLTASNGKASDGFGISVALDGTTALVGAPFVATNGNAPQGAAYVFTESNGTWTQAAELTASDGAEFDYFGFTVALDGATALIGAPFAGVNGQAGQGKAYIFSKSNGTWTQAAELTASDGAESDNFGLAVALNGTTALIGASNAAINGNDAQGAAYVFSESDGAWAQTAELTAGDGDEFDRFGLTVALDGTTALIGAPYAGTGATGVGAAYVFSKSNGTWTQAAELTASQDAGVNQFGVSVSLSGATALVKAFAPPSGTLPVGILVGVGYVFSGANGTWTQRQKLESSATLPFNFGRSVALDGTTALIGANCAPYDFDSGTCGPGAAYFFGESDLGLAVSAPQTVGQGQQYVSQTIATNNASAASPAVSATITVPAAASFVSATATQGTCGEASGVVTCDFGQISGNAGTATANVTLKATGSAGDTIDNTTSIAHATPSLTASAPTTITAGGGCPAGYTEYDDSLEAGQHARSPIYRAPAGEENAILTGPAGFRLFVVFQNAYHGRQTYRIPGNEVHRQAPAGGYTWVVKAGDTGGAYTLCVQHP